MEKKEGFKCKGNEKYYSHMSAQVRGCTSFSFWKLLMDERRSFPKGLPKNKGVGHCI